jgi:hypothetical protein
MAFYIKGYKVLIEVIIQTVVICVIVVPKVLKNVSKETCFPHFHLEDVGDRLVFFCLVSWGGVRLSPLGMSITNCPVAPAPDDKMMNVEQLVE